MAGDPWGGSEPLWHAAAMAALAAGHQVVVSYKYWPNKAKQMQDLEEAGATVHYRQEASPASGLVQKVLNRINPPKAVNPFQPIIDARPDKILISGGSTIDLYSNPLLDPLFNLGVPVVALSQFNFERATYDSWARGRVAQLAPKYAELLFVSERNRRAFELQTLVPMTRGKVVRNPIYVDTTAPLPWPQSDKVHFGYVARLEIAYKGQDLVLEALADPALKAAPIMVNFYGSGPEEAYLKEMAKLLQVEDKVTFHGFFGGKKEDIWGKNHVVMLTSLGEGLPSGLVEGLACGRPALVSDVAGNASVIEQGVTGWAVAPGYAPSITQGILTVLQHVNELQQMGLAAFNQVPSFIDKQAGQTLLNILTEAKV